MHNLSTPSLALIAALPLASCTSIAPAQPVAPPSCSPETLAQFAGQPATAATAERMQAATGKVKLRWVRPGMAVTMDFREDRLTVYVDAANKVERASCS